jgi:hypothetical protein
LEVSREIGDSNGVEIATQCLEDLTRRQRNEQQRRRSRSDSASTSTINSNVNSNNDDDDVEGRNRVKDEEFKFLVPDVPPKTKRSMKPSFLGPTATTDQFFEYLSRVQGNRLDDQRCTFNAATTTNIINNNNNNKPSSSRHHQSSTSSTSSSSSNLPPLKNTQISIEDQMLLDNLAGGTSSGQQQQQQQQKQMKDTVSSSKSHDVIPLVDAIEKSNRFQYHDQRASMSGSGKKSAAANEDEFFSLISRIQSSRIEDQRSTMPLSVGGDRPQSSPGFSSQSRNCSTVHFNHDGDISKDGSQSGRATPVESGIFKRLPRLSKKKK